MKSIMMAAIAAVTLGMTGVAMADQPVARHKTSQQARNETVLPNQRPTYLAGNSTQGSNSVVLPSQRPAYLASNNAQGSNSVVLPSQRPAYPA
jgi:hypothetical protein